MTINTRQKDIPRRQVFAFSATDAVLSVATVARLTPTANIVKLQGRHKTTTQSLSETRKAVSNDGKLETPRRSSLKTRIAYFDNKLTNNVVRKTARGRKMKDSCALSHPSVKIEIFRKSGRSGVKNVMVETRKLEGRWKVEVR